MNACLSDFGKRWKERERVKLQCLPLAMLRSFAHEHKIKCEDMTSVQLVEALADAYISASGKSVRDAFDPIGIDMLRMTVNVLNYCNETFNAAFTAEELIRIVAAHRASAWDLLPDTWEQRQVEEAAKDGTIPNWKEDERGKLIAVYGD